jgi:hypothetical protein
MSSLLHAHPDRLMGVKWMLAPAMSALLKLLFTRKFLFMTAMLAHQFHNFLVAILYRHVQRRPGCIVPGINVGLVCQPKRV